MKAGTLSNVAQGKYLVVWDGLLATLPDEAAIHRFNSYHRVKARGKAIREWETNTITRRALLDLAYRRSYQVDLVTFLDPTYTQKIKARARGDELPITTVYSFTEDKLDEYARLEPYVLGVIHPFTDRPFLFGSKGIPAVTGQAWNL